jgi:hypothetical protein
MQAVPAAGGGGGGVSAAEVAAREAVCAEMGVGLAGAGGTINRAFDVLFWTYEVEAAQVVGLRQQFWDLILNDSRLSVGARAAVALLESRVALHMRAKGV